jgi:hypothetical protein
MLRRREMKRVIKVALAAAIVAFASVGQTLGGTTTIQRSMTTTNGSGASCSQANDCGSCSISCPVGKSAICQSGSDRPAEGQTARAARRRPAFANDS